MATHKELMTALKFDESFKNALRDYYSYGFKGLKDYDAERAQTLKNDWNRLNNILHDYMEWSEGKDRDSIMYAAQDSSSMEENPFHRLYRFCKFNHNDPMAFFNIIFALSGEMQIAGTEDSFLYDRLGIRLLDEAKKRSYYRYIEYFRKHQDQKIELSKESKKRCNWKLSADGRESIVISRKDEKFVLKLYKYWDFINTHTDVHMEGTERIYGTVDGRTEILLIPSSNIDENEMARKLVEGRGKVDLYEKAYLSNIEAFLQDQFELLQEAVEEGEGLSSAQLQCFYPGENPLFAGDNKTIHTKLLTMKELGILKQIPYGGTKAKAAENRWRLQEPVLEDLIEEGQAVDPESDFETAFQTALDFYSKYFVLGVCGTHLQDRLGSENPSPFRFKHEYFMQALNDFDLIDLLDVMEHGKWCEIRYRHGTGDFTSKLLVKPLQVRISYTSGREYLVFYNPVKRSLTSLRLEFIEEIISFEETDVLNAVEELGISKAEVESDLKNARHCLKYMWGVTASAPQEGNVVHPVSPRVVKFRLSYDADREAYIRDRMLRESRSRNDQVGVKILEQEGTIDFAAQVLDPKEMRPWIRSFYSRILSDYGLDTEEFSLSEDVERCIRSIEKLEKREGSVQGRWIKTEATAAHLEHGEKVRAHESLFNEIFSVYYYIIAGVVLQCCSKYREKEVSQEEISRTVEKVQGWFEQKKGIRTDDLSTEEMEWLIVNDAFGTTRTRSGERTTRFKYVCSPDVEFYRNILPLTGLEIRWLKTILADARMGCFLTKEQIRAVRSLLDRNCPDQKELPMDSIVFYDRYTVETKVTDAERLLLSDFTGAIYSETILEVSYTSRRGYRLQGRFKPIVLEFSKRNHRFQACLRSCENGMFYLFNLPQIESVVRTEETFDYEDTLKQYQEYRKEQESSVKVEFYDVRNLADRLLTEFSPWRKYCTYQPDTGLYTLEIFYQQADESEMVIRLMGYGSGIHLPDKEHRIAKEIGRRFQEQGKLLTRESSRPGRETR